MNYEVAFQHLEELEEMIEKNPYQDFLYSHLLAIQIELKRQQSLTNSQNSPKL
jgi:hypothetical protein